MRRRRLRIAHGSAGLSKGAAEYACEKHDRVSLTRFRVSFRAIEA